MFLFLELLEKWDLGPNVETQEVGFILDGFRGC